MTIFDIKFKCKDDFHSPELSRLSLLLRRSVEFKSSPATLKVRKAINKTFQYFTTLDNIDWANQLCVEEQLKIANTKHAFRLVKKHWKSFAPRQRNTKYEKVIFQKDGKQRHINSTMEKDGNRVDTTSNASAFVDRILALMTLAAKVP